MENKILDNNKILDWIKNHKGTTAAILGTLGIGGGLGLFFGLRSGDKKDSKQDEIRKQYFEIYKKILNAYLNSEDIGEEEKISGIIEKNEDKFSENKIFSVLAAILIFGDFKNNEVNFFMNEGNYEVKAKFNISEDEKILHFEIKVSEAGNKEKANNFKLDLKIPEIPEDKIIKFDDNAVRCKILNDFMSDSEFDFKLKNSELVFDSKNNFDAPQKVKDMINNIAKDVTRNLGKEESVNVKLKNGKRAEEIQVFVEVSEDFKACVMKSMFYEDTECKNVIGSDKWEFDIAVKENKKELKEENRDKKTKYKTKLEEIKEEGGEEN